MHPTTDFSYISPLMHFKAVISILISIDYQKSAQRANVVWSYADYRYFRTCIRNHKHHSITKKMVDNMKKEEGEGEASRREEGKNKNTRNLKQLFTELLGNHYCASLLVRGECNWPSIKTDVFFHTTPTPTGCLLPRYWALRGLDEWWTVFLRAVQRLEQSWEL